MRKTACLLALAAVVLACNGEKKRLQKRLAALERQHADLAQRLTARQNAMHEAQQRVDTLHGSLATYNTEVHQFIENHRLAAECIRVGRSAWGEGNAFSGQDSSLTKAGAAICTLGLLSSTFAREVASVADKLRDADVHVQNLQADITAAQRAVDARRSELEGNEAAIDRIEVEIADVRRQLER
jgi:predicted  nucleic acid-binding Zn-ribbon protein